MRTTISIHAPRRGSDIILPVVYLRPRISIHAPRRGSDFACGGLARREGNFNPRSPQGERPSADDEVFGYQDFNPRSPQGERPCFWCHSCQLRHFNPRSPQGERHPIISPCNFLHPFQSTLPAGGATLRYLSVLSRLSNFNPRSPQGERRWKDISAINVNCRFQSTLPAGGATAYRSRGIGAGAISIHAPRRGSDAPRHLDIRRPAVFQSTLPAGGATKSR